MENSQPLKQTRRLVTVGLLTRIFTETLVQMFYAFFPILAAGIGVTPVVFGRLISVRGLAGLLTPLFGNLAERRGYRVTLPIILACGSIGAVLLTLSRNLLFIVPAIFIMGIGVSTLQPLLAAYTSEALPANYRARGMGIIEYGWALASIIGVYAVGQLLKIGGWQAPLLLLGTGLGSMALVFAILLRNQPDLDDTPPISLREQFHITENRTGAFAAITIQALVVYAGLHFFISYSIWLFNEYSFGAVELGSVVLAFGFVDLIASGSVSFLLDWLGRKRALMLGSGFAGLTFLLIGFANSYGLIAGLGFLFFGRFLFEFVIVANIINTSEQSPNQRSRVMSLMAFTATFSQIFAGLTGPVGVERWGVSGLGIPAAIGFILASLLAWHYIE